jgi:hypothetical protein
MTTLRTAAQQALEALTPWMGGDASHTEQYAAYHALRAALAEDALQRFTDVNQEIEAEMQKPVPVAWMCSDPDLAEKGYSRFSSRCEGAWNIPVYTSPPQRKPLTDDEIVNLSDLHSGCYGTTDFARAIEAAHGIKEQS